MIRVLLISVVTLLLALPHGVCFCEFVHAAHCESEADEPEDAPDEHDADCSCKLIHVMVHAPAELNSVADSLVIFVPNDTTFAVTNPDSLSLQFNSDRINLPSEQIPCALRI